VLLVMSDGADSDAARASVRIGNVEARGVEVPSNWDSDCVASGRVVECTSGEDVVRYPVWDECVDRGGRVSRGLGTAVRMNENTKLS
jgi:hypothetical protein